MSRNSDPLLRKPLLFGPPYPSILFTGEKYKTFRVTGGERYSTGDFLSLCDPDSQEFAQATLVSKIRKTFKELTPSDWKGHEIFNSEREMFQIYSNWEGFQVTPTTPLDILQYSRFRVTNPDLIKKLSQSQPKCTSSSPSSTDRYYCSILGYHTTGVAARNCNYCNLEGLTCNATGKHCVAKQGLELFAQKLLESYTAEENSEPSQ